MIWSEPDQWLLQANVTEFSTNQKWLKIFFDFLCYCLKEFLDNFLHGVEEYSEFFTVEFLPIIVHLKFCTFIARKLS